VPRGDRAGSALSLGRGRRRPPLSFCQFPRMEMGFDLEGLLVELRLEVFFKFSFSQWVGTGRCVTFAARVQSNGVC
jgi:hypothetical protein